jgi:adenosylmethionine-8-amino-7-oxononanoate aminotransferase
MEKKGFLKGIQKKSQLLQELVEPLLDFPNVGDIRLRGLMGGIELVKDKKTNEPYPYEWKVGYRVCAEAKKLGVLIRPLSNVIVLMPPLGISESGLKLLVLAVTMGIYRVTKALNR